MHGSSRLGLDIPDGVDPVTNFPTDDAQAMALLDNAFIYLTGTLAARGSISGLVDGTIYRATDTGQYYLWSAAASAWSELMLATDALQLAATGTLAMDWGTASLVVGNGSAVANNLTVNHRLGRTPTQVLATPNGVGSPSPLVVQTFSYTSTTFGLGGQYVSGVASGNTFNSIGWIALG